MCSPEPMDADFLVVGSGIAGLTCALRCAAAGSVLLVTKDRLPESSSQYAQGGIASVWSPEDTFESHIADTLGAGGARRHPGGAPAPPPPPRRLLRRRIPQTGGGRGPVSPTAPPPRWWSGKAPPGSAS